MSFNDLKPGDTMYVVWPSNSMGQESLPVVKVGPKYITLKHGHRKIRCERSEQKTPYLWTVDPPYARVYLSADSYLDFLRATERAKDLKLRLANMLPELPPELVEQMHAMLDAVEGK